MIIDKNTIRKELLRRRRAQAAAATVEAGRAISLALASLEELVDSSNIAAFMPFDGEPDLSGCLAWALEVGKKLFFPRESRGGDDIYEMAPVSSLRDFEAGRYGVLEPAGRISAAAVPDGAPWLVPGVAFDLQGNRLGFGKGIYDRLLNGVAGIKIAIAYEWQIVPAVPVRPGDAPVDMIVTESAIHRINKHTTKGRI